VACGELPQELGEWWTRFIDQDTSGRMAMLTPEKSGPRRRRTRRRKPAAAADALPAGDAAAS